MKKIAFTFLALLLCSICLAQKIEQGFGMSYTTTEEYEISRCLGKDRQFIRYDLSGYRFQYQLRFTYKDFKIKSNTFCYFDKESLAVYRPTLMNFEIGLFYKFKKLEIGLQHRCLHPCISSGKEYETMVMGGYSLRVSLNYNIE